MKLTRLHNTCSMRELGDFYGDESAENIKRFIDNSIPSPAIIANINRVDTPLLGSNLMNAGFKRLVSWRNRDNALIITYFLKTHYPTD